MNSIWQEVALPRFPQLQKNITTDVLIIGGGMAGLLCAHQLTRCGIPCVVAEAERIASGVTRGTTAKLTSQHGLIYHKLIAQSGPEAAAGYLEANQSALAAYRELCSGMDCDYQVQDHFIYSQDRKLLESECSALESLGYPAAVVEDLPLPFPTAGAVRFPDQAQFHPLKFLAEILPELTIYEHTPVRSLRKTTARTDFGSITAKAVIVATHFPFLNTHGSYFLKLYQQRSYVLALENAPHFDGMYLGSQEGDLSFRQYGDLLLLGGGGHRTGLPGGGWEALEKAVQDYYPDAKIHCRWAAQDCMSLDSIPYIGQYSARTPGLYVATGFNKWGMTSSMVAARLLTDLIQGKQNPYTELFSPSRSMLHPQLGTNLWESTKHILTFSKPRCPHLGCALEWNPKEHSWDCPCHGSRFGEDGKLLDGPATGDLPE